MKPFSRADRVGALMQEVLSDVLHRDIKDPRLDLVTITGIKLSSDLKNARIYFSVTGGAEKVAAALSGFERASGYIRRKLASELELRQMPGLKFFYDESFDYGAHIDSVLRSVIPANSEDDGDDHTAPERE